MISKVESYLITHVGFNPLRNPKALPSAFQTPPRGKTGPGGDESGIGEFDGKGVPCPNGHRFVLENGKQGRPTPGKEGKSRPSPFQFTMDSPEGRVFLEDEFLEIVLR